MDTKKILTHLIRAGRNAMSLENVLTSLGYKETPYFNLYGDISEAVYTLLGEKTESFEDSVTYAVMVDPLMSDADCAEELASLVCVPNISDNAMDVISEVAETRGIPVSTLIRIILNEWAMREIFSTAVM